MLVTFIVGLSQAQSLEEYYSGYKENITKKGTNAAAFLEIGVGAKAQAMGGAFTAVADDISALYWNPAGIVQLKGAAVSANYTEWLADIKQTQFGLVLPVLNRYAVGLNVNYFNTIESQKVRTINEPEGTGEYYGASDLCIAATMAASITDRFSIGMNFKYIRQQIWHETASAGAFDIGVLYQSQLKGLTIGTSISNYGTDLKLEGRDLVFAYDADEQHYSSETLNGLMKTEECPLPLLFRFGLAYRFEIFPRNNITIAMDLNHPSNNVESMNLGVEYDLRNLLMLRAGYESMFDDESENGLTFGGGIRLATGYNSNVTFNYSFSSWGILDNVQRYSIDIVF
jgi:long-subunit fatty acid transport protein